MRGGTGYCLGSSLGSVSVWGRGTSRDWESQQWSPSWDDVCHPVSIDTAQGRARGDIPMCGGCPVVLGLEQKSSPGQPEVPMMGTLGLGPGTSYPSQGHPSIELVTWRLSRLSPWTLPPGKWRVGREWPPNPVYMYRHIPDTDARPRC